VTTEWWQGLGPVETDGPPGAEEHRLAWSGGELRLVAHPDPDADRAMHALGAPVCPCLPMLDAWERAHADGGFLVVASRDPAERLPVPTEAIALLTADLARWQGAIAALRADDDRAALDRLAAAAAPAEADARRRLGALLLLALDHRLQLRLQASIAATIGDGPALEVATAGRALGPLHAIGWGGGRSRIRLGDEPSVDGDEATLPRAWIPRVWATGLANAVSGHLVVDVTSVTPGGPADVVAMAPGKARVVFRVDRWENA
jgi:hypothetical protein